MRRALFLDRDGVINVDSGYVFRQEDFIFVPGIFELCEFFAARDHALIIITNQSGLARGYFSQAELEALHDFLRGEFASRGLEIKAIYHCPHHPDEDCFCRKPRPGLIHRAADEWGLDLGNSIFIGDKLTDMQAGQAGGVGRGFLVNCPPPDLSQGEGGDFFRHFADLAALLEFLKSEKDA